MNDTIKILFGLFGGLAIFIFGMNMMSVSVRRSARYSTNLTTFRRRRTVRNTVRLWKKRILPTV